MSVSIMSVDYCYQPIGSYRIAAQGIHHCCQRTCLVEVEVEVGVEVVVAVVPRVEY